MGLDLKVAPIKYAKNVAKDWWLARDVLSFDRDYSLFGQIQRIGNSTVVLNPVALPAGVEFQWYSDEGIKTLTTDAYGTLLTWVPTHEFGRVNFRHSHSMWNQVVVQFLTSLPKEMPVVLYWC